MSWALLSLFACSLAMPIGPHGDQHQQALIQNEHSAVVPLFYGDNYLIQNQYLPITYLDLTTIPWDAAQGCNGYTVVTSTTRIQATPTSWQFENQGQSGCVKYGDTLQIKEVSTGYYLDACWYSPYSACGGFAVQAFKGVRDNEQTGLWRIVGGTTGACVPTSNVVSSPLEIQNLYTGGQNYLDACGLSVVNGVHGASYAVQTFKNATRDTAGTGTWKIYHQAPTSGYG